ncbi:MAG: MATE family efflux transporter [Lachnospirales bacterium]
METKDLTQGSITKSLLVVAIPTIISMLLQLSYNMVDMYFLGIFDKTGGAISSVATASLFISFAYAFNFLSTTGTGIKVSHQIGEKDYDDFFIYVNTGLKLTAIIALICGLIFNLFGRELVLFSNLQEEIIVENSILYLRIYGFTIIFYSFNSLFVRIMTSMGESIRALIITAVGFVINIVLNYLLIVVFEKGILGASIASLVGNMIVTFIFYIDQKSIFSFKKEHQFNMSYFKSILKLGAPYTLQIFLFSVIGLLSGRTLIGFGSSVIAGQKLGAQIETITIMVTSGLLTSMSAFVGQNYGACEFKRIKESYKICLFIGLAYVFVTSFIFFFYSDNIIRIFVNNEEVIKYAKHYLWFVAIGQSFAVLEVVGNGLYNGIGKPIIAGAISVTITPFRLVISALLKGSLGAIAVFVGILVTTVVKGVLSFSIYFLKVRKTLTSEMIE